MFENKPRNLKEPETNIVNKINLDNSTKYFKNVMNRTDILKAFNNLFIFLFHPMKLFCSAQNMGTVQYVTWYTVVFFETTSQRTSNHNTF